MEFYAHSTERMDCSDWEAYGRHSAEVGKLAGTFAAKFGAAKAAILAGRMHDLGKLCREFQDYIRGRLRRGPDHSTAGAREILALAAGGPDRLIVELLAYGIAGHHAGLPDKQGGDGSSLVERIRNTDLPQLDPDWRSIVALDANGLMPAGFAWSQDRQRIPVQLAFLGRMLFSCLVDADYLATEAFYAKARHAPVDRDWPKLPEIVDSLIDAFDRYMGDKLAGLPEQQRAASINLLRNDILVYVRGQGGMPQGVFTLDVPTGGGKTLASLAFALQHAQAHRMDRIVYAIPFTSIIDQTVEIFQNVLGQGVVLEHHSAVDAKPKPEDRDAARDARPDAKLRLAMENWNAPIVVTTNVQLFESLFASRPSRCRKLHNLANAIIILDECQTIPLHVLRPCVAALDELARNYGCTIVLCTATQPALLAPKFAGGFEAAHELAPDPARLHKTFRRVRLRVRGEMSDAALISEFGECEQGLVIVNSRGHALSLYLAAQEVLGADGLVHLTTRQTAADRRCILAEVRRRLKAGERCRLIATSLIEAGVDLSFPRAWRAEAGLDQVIQAAGRVNREWRWRADESFVDVFRPENAKPPAEIAGFAEAMTRTAQDHADDLFARAAIERYFREVYWQKGDGLDRTMMAGRDRPVPQAVLDKFMVSGGTTDFAYRTVGEAFRLIKEGMEPVLIVCDEAPRIVLAELRSGRLSVGRTAQGLQPFLVQVPPCDRRALIDNGHATFVEGFGDQLVELRTESFYTRESGLVWEKADELGVENFLI